MRQNVKYSRIDSESLKDQPSRGRHHRSLCYASIAVLSVVGLLAVFIPLIYMYVVLPSRHTAIKQHGASQHPQVTTTCGLVEGVTENGAHVFKGIPYAVPPVGDRRWTRPEGLSREKGTCWEEAVFKAKEFGNSCAQTMFQFQGRHGEENCLFLNVWTPSVDPGARLPVLFWIHGGYLLSLDGNVPGYSPTASLAADSKAVFVSLNYRLGPFGFLTLDLLSKASPDGRSGNYGLMDQILALEWVQNNIRNFGGDPGKVTVFGQSSGGTSIFALLASPPAAGLFHRAWVSSGSPLFSRTMQQASQDNAVFLSRSGCDDVTCLRGLSSLQLLNSTPWVTFPHWGMQDLLELPEKGRFDGSLVVIDGYVLPDSPINTFAKGLGNDVAVVITHTAQEADIQPSDPGIANWTWGRYDREVRGRLTPFGPHLADTALQLYPPGSNYTPEFMYTSMITDMRAGCSNDVITNAAAKAFSSPVYRAVITSSPSAPFRLGVFAPKYAFHGWDFIAFFDGFAAFGFKPSTSDVSFQKALRQLVLQFAASGRLDVPEWQPGRKSVALVSEGTVVAENYLKTRCDFWMGHGFFQYAWIN